MLCQQGKAGAAVLAHAPIGESSWMETKPHHRYILPDRTRWNREAQISQGRNIAIFS